MPNCSKYRRGFCYRCRLTLPPALARTTGDRQGLLLFSLDRIPTRIATRIQFRHRNFRETVSLTGSWSRITHRPSSDGAIRDICARKTSCKFLLCGQETNTVQFSNVTHFDLKTGSFQSESRRSCTATLIILDHDSLVHFAVQGMDGFCHFVQAPNLHAAAPPASSLHNSRFSHLSPVRVTVRPTDSKARARVARPTRCRKQNTSESLQTDL